jgi:hypothetical protein
MPVVERGSAPSIREHHLAQYHPQTAQMLYDLAILRKTQGNLNEALSLAERALKIRSQALGESQLILDFLGICRFTVCSFL